MVLFCGFYDAILAGLFSALCRRLFGRWREVITALACIAGYTVLDVGSGYARSNPPE